MCQIFAAIPRCRADFPSPRQDFAWKRITWTLEAFCDHKATARNSRRRKRSGRFRRPAFTRQHY
jgi:hypothetical protein